ncbi:hypothetical protein NP233_g2675 [Leucocoprinus birnbaumii]|uniref:Beta-lactamase-related domain-containing protein n=1 Tax=Leucocoprinus birnbaumii TaxID=56174 RepID=A0AAD5W0Y2_9AGAR|nr:hypothetical protein NP233_g2675 [Leucocoprinus birnbaumii]
MDSKHDTVIDFPSPKVRDTLKKRYGKIVAFITLIGLARLWTFNYHQKQHSSVQPGQLGCSFPLPNHLLKEHPLQPGEGALPDSSRKLHAYLSARTADSDIDSLSIAIVTPTGTLFEQGYGILKANETVSDKPVSRDSIYRIASITKMFTTLETLILRERGVLDLDDAVEKHLPEVKYPSYGWSEHLKGEDTKENSNGPRPRVTLRQLASHMSGIGRDFPPLDIEWPQDSPIPDFGHIRTQGDLPIPEHRYEDLIEAVNKYPLVNLPYDYPIYSNSGIDLLGLANVAANSRSAADPASEPQTHEDLIKRDIFEPLGLNSSFYRIPHDSALVDDLAIPSENHEWADFTFDNADAPAGGQYSSLADLELILQSFLNPTKKQRSNFRACSQRMAAPALHLEGWFSGNRRSLGDHDFRGRRPYVYERSGHSSVLILERELTITSGGNLPGYHSEFVVVPELQYGIIVLVTGTYSNTATFVHEAVSLFQPAIQTLLGERVNDTYSGRWIGVHGEDEGTTSAEVKTLNGGLYMTELFVRGYDILKIVEDADVSLQKPYPIALWSTGRPGEFRLAFGRKQLNSDPMSGCMPYWVSIDNPIYSHGAPIDLVYWDGQELIYPSAGARFTRV